MLANSGDPDQMPHSAVSDLTLHCLHMSFLLDAKHDYNITGILSYRGLLVLKLNIMMSYSRIKLGRLAPKKTLHTCDVRQCQCLWNCRIQQLLGNSFAQLRDRRHERCHICHYLSRKD